MATTKKAASTKKAAKKSAPRARKKTDGTCSTCGGATWVAREGALMTQYLQEDGSWEKGPVPADRVPCQDCSSGYYPTST